MDELDWMEPGAHAQARPVVEDAKRRLLRLGAGALTDAELVALVTGLSSDAALAALLEHGLHGVAQRPLEALLETPRLGAQGASRLVAAVELARRLGASHESSAPRLGTPQAIWDWARPRVVGARREEFHVLCLNSRNQLLRHVRVAEGSVDQCHVDPREALAPAVACRATGIVLVHNHPSGDPEPSVHDVALTRQLRDGARLLCIRLLDHLVVSETGYVSMLARGLIGDDRAPLPRLQAQVDVDGA
jgi:DNA repair protein RadC